MTKPAGDEETRFILRKRYVSVGCYVCKKHDHIHHNCPSRPCYLCKKPGHLSVACPHRLKPGAHTAAMRALKAPRGKRSRIGPWLRARELESPPEAVHPALLYIHSPQFRCKAAVALRPGHSKRITAMEWHPAGRHAVTADKAGAVWVWNLGDAIEGRYFNKEALPRNERDMAFVHHCNINNIVFDPTDSELVYTTASDGIVCALRLSLLSGRSPSEGGECVREREQVFNFNPEGFHGQRDFKMAYGMAYDGFGRKCLYVGASNGLIARVDPREGVETPPETIAKFHKDKVTCIHLNPTNSNLIATASNDKKVCLWDARKFAPGHELGTYLHGRAVSSAYFSPYTGSRLLTTSLDNKIQLWSDVHGFSGDVNALEDGSLTEIVHSHNFHRYLNPFRATWDPKDWHDDLFICGRFLGDAYFGVHRRMPQRPTMLHPIDLFSARTGTVVQSLIDPIVLLKCTTNKFSPTQDLILTAASRDLFLWAPPEPKADKDSGRRDGLRRRGGFGSSDDEDSSEDNDDDDDEDDDARNSRKLKMEYGLAKRRERIQELRRNRGR